MSVFIPESWFSYWGILIFLLKNVDLITKQGDRCRFSHDLAALRGAFESVNNGISAPQPTPRYAPGAHPDQVRNAIIDWPEMPLLTDSNAPRRSRRDSSSRRRPPSGPRNKEASRGPQGALSSRGATCPTRTEPATPGARSWPLRSLSFYWFTSFCCLRFYCFARLIWV